MPQRWFPGPNAQHGSLPSTRGPLPTAHYPLLLFPLGTALAFTHPITFANSQTSSFMIRFNSLALASFLLASAARSQTSDIVVFSEMGEKFTLVIDGDVKNEIPATRVVATGIRNETPLIVVRVAETGVPPVKQNAWMEYGKEYTLKLTTNKKGEYVLRMQGQAELGSAKPTQTAKAAHTNFVDDSEKATPAQPSTGGDVKLVTTTTTVQTTGTGDLDGENVNMNIGINGMGINMGVNVNDNMGATQSTTTTTHTTTTTGTTVQATTAAAAENESAYRMPGYTGPIGCNMPMNEGEFSAAKQSLESKGFEDSKMTLAKQIARDRCFSVAQVKSIMGMFSFEDSKLEFSKFAYDHTYDMGNYYQVNDAFSFESSIDDLNKYIQSR